MSKDPRLNGWIPDRPDGRDISYRTLRPQSKLLKAIVRPRRVDLRGQHFPAVFNQGNVGSCVAQATSAACAYAISKEDYEKEGYEPWVMSRLFIYFNARNDMPGGDTNVDSGTYIREAMKSLSNYGACLEDPYWPYVESQWPVKPPDAAYKEADHREIGVAYFRIENTNLNDMLDCLAQGYPIVFGATIYGELMNVVGPNYMVGLPKPWDTPAGGHAMLIVGYDMAKRAFLVRNSWGDDWGDKGHCWFPFKYLCNGNLADDFWTLRKIAK